AGVFNVVHGGFELGRRLASHAGVDIVFFVGAFEKAQKIEKGLLTDYAKTLVLDTGGKNGFLVWEDAPYESTLQHAFYSAFLTSGQRATSAHRILVHESLFDRFVSDFHGMAKRCKIGYGLHEGEDTPFLGPLLSEKSVENYLAVQGIAVREGCEEIMRGKPIERKERGYYVSPSLHVVHEPKPKSVYEHMEIFGPNAAFYRIRDLEEAMTVFKKVHDKIYAEIEKMGRDYVSLYNLTSREFYESNPEFFRELVAREKKPVLLSFYPEGSNYYWVLNIEYHIIDKIGRPREIGTVQIDTGNAERFGISYTDREGRKAYPVILHTALIGTIERYLYTVLDTALRCRPPMLPTWLSPTQVRVIPVSEKYLKHARRVVERLTAMRVRADLDDRNESLSKKVYEAEVAWIPYIVVVGGREVRTGRLNVRVRKTGGRSRMTLRGLSGKIASETRGYPFRPLKIPVELSKRPVYSG
ncbi:MAG: aldehyde dehydrogenase family protein, partial [Nitrososphaerota archaeon]